MITTNQWAHSNNTLSVSVFCFVLLGLTLFLFFDFQMVHIGGATKPYSIHSQWLFSWTHEKRFKSRIWNWILVFTLLFLLYYAASDINFPVFVEQLIGWSPLVLFIPSLLHLGPDNNRVTGHHLQYNCFCLTFGYRKTSLNLLSLSSFLKYWIFSVKIQFWFSLKYFFSLLTDMKHFWISTLIFVFTKCERGWMGVGWVHPRRMWRGESKLWRWWSIKCRTVSVSRNIAPLIFTLHHHSSGALVHRHATHQNGNVKYMFLSFLTISFTDDSVNRTNSVGDLG